MNIRYSIPAPGFTRANGKRRPNKAWGERVYCQIRNGLVDESAPWLVSEVRWIHDGSNGDVVAIKAA